MDENRPSPDPDTPADPEAQTGPGDDASPETREAFAELLSRETATDQPRWKKGEKIRATVVRVTDEWVFVSLGGKEEGSIRRAEFGGGEGEAAAPADGDEVEAYVLSTGGGEVVLTTQLGRRDASREALEQAWESRIPVEGRVVKTIKGGFEVRISGVRAFCPLSQIDLRWPKQPEVFVGQTLSFRIVEFKDRGRNVVVSRRVLLEEARAEKREALLETVVPGAVVNGVVRSLHDFGAFVDLGGVEALVPVSELRWGRVESPADVLQVGQEVTAKVLTVDWDRDRVSLSLKALAEDPWQAVASKYAVGQRVQGTVARIAPFGAFVTLEPGVDGLVHISALGAGRRVRDPGEVVQPGQTVEVEILSVDPAARKVALSMEHRYWESLGDLPSAGDVIQGEVEKVAGFGVFVKLPSGHTGLVPGVEMGTPKGTDHARMFKPGDPMEVMVLGVEEGGRRIRLSRKALGEREEREAREAYQASQGGGGGSFGTLGDLFKDKFGAK